MVKKTRAPGEKAEESHAGTGCSGRSLLILIGLAIYFTHSVLPIGITGSLIAVWKALSAGALSSSRLLY